MAKAGAPGLNSEGADAVGDPIAGEFDVFGADVAADLAWAGSSVVGVIGGAGVELEIGRVVTKASQGAAGMVPRGDDNDPFGAEFSELGDGELGVLLGVFGVGLEDNGGAWDTTGFEDTAVVLGIAFAAEDDFGGLALFEKFGGAFRPFAHAAAEQNHRICLNGAALEAKDLPRESEGNGQQQEKQAGESKKDAAETLQNDIMNSAS